MSRLSWSRKDFSNRTYQKMLVNYLVFNTNEFWSRSALVCSKIFPEWLQDQTQRTEYCLQRPQKSKVTKEDTLLLIQIDGQTNWTINEPDLNQTKNWGIYGNSQKRITSWSRSTLLFTWRKIYWFLERWGKRWFREINIHWWKSKYWEL